MTAQDTPAKKTLKLGAFCGIPSQTCLISRRTRDGLGAPVGTVVRIQAEDGNVVTRRVLKSPNVAEKDVYVFLAPEDLDFLNANIADTVELSLDAGGVECP